MLSSEINSLGSPADSCRRPDMEDEEMTDEMEEGAEEGMDEDGDAQPPRISFPSCAPKEKRYRVRQKTRKKKAQVSGQLLR